MPLITLRDDSSTKESAIEEEMPDKAEAHEGLRLLHNTFSIEVTMSSI